MPTWPTTARLQFKPFSEQRETALLSSDMESGPPKVVRIKSRVMVRRPVSVRFKNKADYLAFIAWFQTDIKHGALWFDWFDPVTRTTRQAKISKGELGDAAPVAPLNINGAWVMPMTLETWQ